MSIRKANHKNFTLIINPRSLIITYLSGIAILSLPVPAAPLTIVRNLLDFARQYKPKKEVIEIHQVLKSVFDILAYDLRSNNISLVTDFSPDVPSTMADPHKLQQVFANLITNRRGHRTGAGGLSWNYQGAWRLYVGREHRGKGNRLLC